MKHYIAKFILWLMGWKVFSEFPKEQVNKCVFVVAPHTSYWDFYIGRLAFWYLKIDTHFLIKKEVFNSIIGPPLKAIGGVPVDRRKGNNTIKQVADVFSTQDVFHLIVTPEGTRKYITNWKRGFYQIAKDARVPVYMCWMNYRLKHGGIGPEFIITGDYEEDFKQIEEFYKDKWAKFPENFNLGPKPNNK